MIRHLAARGLNALSAGITVGLAAAMLCGTPSPAQAVSLSNISTDALLSVSIAPSQGVDVLRFVSDDGQNPLTTFAFRDPDGVVGSSAVATGSVSSQPGNALSLTASGNTRAEGVQDPLIEVALGQTTLSGGFVIVNSLGTGIDANLSVEWSWTMDISAAGSAVDLGLGQVHIELLVDGISLNVPVDVLLTAPPNGVYSDSGVFSTMLNIPMQGSREVSLGVFALSLAQSTIPAAPVPEPATWMLFVAGMCCVAVSLYKRQSSMFKGKLG